MRRLGTCSTAPSHRSGLIQYNQRSRREQSILQTYIAVRNTIIAAALETLGGGSSTQRSVLVSFVVNSSSGWRSTCPLHNGAAARVNMGSAFVLYSWASMNRKLWLHLRTRVRGMVTSRFSHFTSGVNWVGNGRYWRGDETKESALLSRTEPGRVDCT